jgi:hypothetical protein
MITNLNDIEPRLIKEFHDRKVCGSILIYSIIVWLVFQVSEIVVPAVAICIMLVVSSLDFGSVALTKAEVQVVKHGQTTQESATQLAEVGTSHNPLDDY